MTPAQVLRVLPTRGRWPTLALLTALGTAPLSASAEPGLSDDLKEIIQRAQADALAQSRPWHRLLHYRSTLLGGFVSEADSDSFFAHPEGRTDPEGELTATLQRFFESAELGEEHAQCLFPARFRWLVETLSIDRNILPRPKCVELGKFMQVMDGSGATLVFASAYLNAPPSMYGHTFLRIDRRTAPGVELLAHIINYAANPWTYNPILYVILGITGGFDGRFAAMPYYMKIQEYSNLESRDLWEYRLDLNASELDMLLRHAWELDQTSFDYYFFDENCSYHMLTLLEAARPSLQLSDRFEGSVIPTDTIKAVLDEPGLVVERTFRPSHVRQMQARRQKLTQDESHIAASLATAANDAALQSFDALASDRQLQVLDAAYDFFKYTYGFSANSLTDEEKQRESLLLSLRSHFREPSEPATVEHSAPPEVGHGSSRVGLAAGTTTGGKPFQELHWRPAFHDLLDRQLGYTEDSALAMGSLRLRTVPSQFGSSDPVILERFDIVAVTSMVPWEGWVTPLSWRLRLGWERVSDRGCMRWDCTAFNLEGGPGVAVSTQLLNREVFYTFFDVNFQAGPAFATNYRGRVDLAMGALVQLLDSVRFHVEGRLYYDLIGQQRDLPLLRVDAGVNVALGQNLAMRVAGVGHGVAPTPAPTAEAWLSFYYYYN